MGRIVLTHSTYLEGLVPILRKLAANQSIKTVTPATISKVRGRTSKLIIRISVEIVGGYKAIARKGQTAQEIFITTDLNKEELSYLLTLYCAK